MIGCLVLTQRTDELARLTLTQKLINIINKFTLIIITDRLMQVEQRPLVAELHGERNRIADMRRNVKM